MRKTATNKSGERADPAVAKRKTKRKPAATDVGGQATRKEEAVAVQEADAAPAREETQLELIRKLIERLSSQLTSSENSKGTMGDLLKLLQLEKEMTPQEHRELVVSWETPWDEQ